MELKSVTRPVRALNFFTFYNDAYEKKLDKKNQANLYDQLRNVA